MEVVQGAVFDEVTMEALELFTVERDAESVTVGDRHDIVHLAERPALDHISHLPPEQGLTRLVYPLGSGAHVQVRGRADSCVAGVAPETDPHRFAGGDESCGTTDTPEDREVGHNRVWHTKRYGPSDVGYV